ncbi:oligoribonuclease [Candidatus Dependentiae bacterium]|nr:oligoribonuclease [Candidatus Dependentiae bacterium]
MNKDKNLVWIDLEMTGLDPRKDVIIEIATIITDSQLNELELGPHLIINQPSDILAKMNSEVIQMHTKSGLIDAVKKSIVTVQQAEKQTLKFIKKYCSPQTGLLCGNSVWQDRNFLFYYMPSIVDYLYYRIIDVTAVKEVVARWYPRNLNSEFQKKDTHRALEDIRESIAELKHFRQHFFVR